MAHDDQYTARRRMPAGPPRIIEPPPSSPAGERAAAEGSRLLALLAGQAGATAL
jgi:hypothetical protein